MPYFTQKSMLKKKQTTKDRLDEAEPKKMKKQTLKDRLAEAEGKKKSMLKKKQTTKDRLDEAEPKRKVSWMWRGKKYSGTLIPSKEDKDNRYARTTNGNIKVLPKKKKGSKK